MTPHVDVGAYLLGALDEAEMTRFEEHLAECESCGRELDELSGLLPVLHEMREDGVAFAHPPGGDAMLGRLLDQVARERGARKRRRLAAVAAVAVLVVGGPLVAVLATDDGGGRPAAGAFASDQRSATNPETGVRATVGIADKGWGSVVDLRLTGVRGPQTCRLVAVALDGNGQTVATWAVPETGYGTDAQPRPLTVHGAAGLHKDSISRFEIRAADGTLLVSVPL
ncbi:zf-HC2 domain-containing protein [Streptomyces sp. NPDC088197]|uniref:zf-HC2 domain-containing protein n=1 Tax=unclassified Streptomyces TaxID=2593676 RepID=UPI0033BAB1FF